VKAARRRNLSRLGDLSTSDPYFFAFLPLALGAADGSPARVVAWDSASRVR
jgi:kynurenine formamidase